MYPKIVITMIFLLFKFVLYSQKQVDTLSIAGHKFLLERTKMYFTGNYDINLNVLRTQHKVKTKMICIETFERGTREFAEFDASGYESLVNSSFGKDKLKTCLYNFVDSIKLNNKKLNDFSIKMSGQVFLIDQAQFIASNDTCSYLISITTGPDSENILKKLFWTINDLKSNSIYITSIFYRDKLKNVNFIPVQFCLIPD